MNFGGGEVEAVADQVECGFDGCAEPAERIVDGHRPLCAGHRKQLQRTGRLTPLRQRSVDPRERLVRAALAWADADSEDDAAYDRAEEAFWEAHRACAAASLGRRGGLAAVMRLDMTPETRREFGRRLAAIRWRPGGAMRSASHLSPRNGAASEVPTTPTNGGRGARRK